MIMIMIASVIMVIIVIMIASAHHRVAGSLIFEASFEYDQRSTENASKKGSGSWFHAGSSVCNLDSGEIQG